MEGREKLSRIIKMVDKEHWNCDLGGSEREKVMQKTARKQSRQR